MMNATTSSAEERVSVGDNELEVIRRGAGRPILLLHGGILARHDLRTQKEIWSQPLIDKKKIAEETQIYNTQVVTHIPLG